mmetsp:Transcript_13139/g.30225  ORF Transcript_13139/g.30225 Transcript_13139/m.30225 type:complete len:875 (-) Transcript_13139:54-2678(-)
MPLSNGIRYPFSSSAYSQERRLTRPGDTGWLKIWKAKVVTSDTITREVVLKIFDLEQNSRNDSDTLSDIQKEISVMCCCKHGNIVRLHTSFASGHELWMILDYMDRGSCGDQLKFEAFKNGFPECIIAYIMWQTLKGIDYLHQQSMIHRDIKADNILIDQKFRVKVTDFWKSSSLEHKGADSFRRKKVMTFVGTPCWMAPEVIEQEGGYDNKADIWSFGITLMELANGKTPYDKQKPLKVLKLIMCNDPPQLEGNFSSELKQIVKSCLIKEPPSERPSAEALLSLPYWKHAKAPEGYTLFDLHLNAEKGVVDLSEQQVEEWMVEEWDFPLEALQNLENLNDNELNRSWDELPGFLSEQNRIIEEKELRNSPQKVHICESEVGSRSGKWSRKSFNGRRPGGREPLHTVFQDIDIPAVSSPATLPSPVGSYRSPSTKTLGDFFDVDYVRGNSKQDPSDEAAAMAESTNPCKDSRSEDCKVALRSDAHLKEPPAQCNPSPNRGGPNSNDDVWSELEKMLSEPSGVSPHGSPMKGLSPPTSPKSRGGAEPPKVDLMAVLPEESNGGDAKDAAASSSEEAKDRSRNAGQESADCMGNPSSLAKTGSHDVLADSKSRSISPASSSDASEFSGQKVEMSKSIGGASASEAVEKRNSKKKFNITSTDLTSSQSAAALSSLPSPLTGPTGNPLPPAAIVQTPHASSASNTPLLEPLASAPVPTFPGKNPPNVNGQPSQKTAADGQGLTHTNSHKAKKAFKIEDAPPPAQSDGDGHAQRIATRSSSISSTDSCSRRSFEYNRENLDLLHEPALRWSFDVRRDKQSKDGKFQLAEEMQLEAMDMKDLCVLVRDLQKQVVRLKEETNILKAENEKLRSVNSRPKEA